MTVDIFIRTYKGDLEWLKYCLRSIVKYTSGYRQVIVCIPESQVGLLKPFNLTLEKVVTCPEYKNDYLGQQITKLKAWEYTDADAILYVDSDCAFDTPCGPEYFLDKGRPIVYKSQYGEALGDANCWKAPTELFLGEPVEYEYMRRLPLLYLTKTVKAVHDLIPDIEKSVMGNGVFSEFNLLGAYAEKNEPKQYKFIDIIPVPPNDDFVLSEQQTLCAVKSVVRQKWSWGGLTSEIKKELNELLEVNY